MRAIASAALLALLLAGCAAPVATRVGAPAVAVAPQLASPAQLLPPSAPPSAVSPSMPPSEAPAAASADDAPVEFEHGLASWYGRRFQGRRTASGERFDLHALTAAHRFLPFDTVVRVVNAQNGREVEVRINDRGPHLPGRIIDLSQAAAQALDMHGDGLQEVVLYAAPEAVAQAEVARNNAAPVPPKPQRRLAP